MALNLAQAQALILSKKTTNADLIHAQNNHEIQIDGSGNVLQPINGVFTILSNQAIIDFATALQTQGA